MKREGKRLVIILFVVSLLASFFSAITIEAREFEETEQSREDRMKWWIEARFGMFIHWGLYSMAARNEWVKRHARMTDEEYQKYFDLYNPDLYAPIEWARAAKKAGMKYFVITTKHHEGFCLWDSQYTDYKVINTPYGKDLIKPMVKAFRDEGIRVGFYYSLIDWHHPEYTIDRSVPMHDDEELREKVKDRDIRIYAEYMHNQVRELLTDFGRIDCIFLDFSFPNEKDGKGREDWQSEKLLKMVRELQPHIIVNDRLDLIDIPGGWDFRTPEQFMPREWPTIDGKRVPWETCQTFSGAWGYSRDETTWKSVQQLITMLIETVSKGGNLLLNVGPTARGTFGDGVMERLNGIGEWMKLHSRSIYGCTQAPVEFKPPENCILTFNPKTNRVYIHILQWPTGKLFLQGFSGKIKYAQLLNDASELRFVKSIRSPVFSEEIPAGTKIIELPMQKPNVTIPVIEIFIK